MTHGQTLPTSLAEAQRQIIALEARVKAADVLAWEVQIRIEAHEESALLRPYLAYRATKGEAP